MTPVSIFQHNYSIGVGEVYRVAAAAGKEIDLGIGLGNVWLNYSKYRLAATELDLMEIPGRRLQLAPVQLQATLQEALQQLDRSGAEALYVERMTAPGNVEALVKDNRMGRKNGRGFYVYEDGKKKGPDASVYTLFGQDKSRKAIPKADIQKRVGLAFVNEAARCLEDGILRSPRDGDIGAIFGLGFPPFRGGALHYMDDLGIEKAHFAGQHTGSLIMVDLDARYNDRCDAMCYGGLAIYDDPAFVVPPPGGLREVQAG